MRDYGQIQCSFWTDPEIQQLSDAAKCLAAYLLTGPHSNALGCYRLPAMYLMADFGWSEEKVEGAFSELEGIKFCHRCKSTGFILMPKFLRWNPVPNGKVAAARVKEFDSVPKSASIYPELCRSMIAFMNHIPSDFLESVEGYLSSIENGSKTRSDTVSDHDPNPEQNRTEQNRTEHSRAKAGPSECDGEEGQAKKGDEYPADFEAAWSTYPRRSGGNPKKGAFRAWSARVKAGADPAELLAGVSRYAQHVRAEGKENTRFVMQAATFFGPDEHYAEPWAAASDAGESELDRYLAEQGAI